jgi:hypothetical protein
MLPLRIKIFSAFLKMEVQGHHLPQARCNSSTLLSMPPSLLHFPSRPASFATEGFGCSSHPSTPTYCRSTSENVAQAPDGKPFANCARKPGGLNSSSRAHTLLLLPAAAIFLQLFQPPAHHRVGRIKFQRFFEIRYGGGVIRLAGIREAE